MSYPEDSIQNVLGADWWIEDKENNVKRGSLIWSFVPHFDQIPFMFEPVGRSNAEEHGAANVTVKPLRVDAPLKQVDLPVAAMTRGDNEVWSAYKAKKRPCVVLATEGNGVESALTKGKAKSQTAPTILCAPYYGADQNGKRSGYSERFVERVRHCEYPQFFWDQLPLKGADESILRIDQLQPIGAHYNSYKLAGYTLSEEALSVLDELLQWLIYGGVEEDGYVALYRSEIESIFGE